MFAKKYLKCACVVSVTGRTLVINHWKIENDSATSMGGYVEFNNVHFPCVAFVAFQSLMTALSEAK